MSDDRQQAGAAPRPWQREPGPWLLMLGPAIVVVAGFITLWLAMSSSDGLVSEDYYKRGLAINQTLAQSDRAVALGLVAAVSVSSSELSVRLEGTAAGFEAPAALRVQVSHPTRAGLDQTLTLRRQDGRYAGAFKLPAAGHWLLQLEDEARTWSLLGNLVLPANGETRIGASDPAPPKR